MITRAASELGRKGGKARAKSLSKEEIAEIGRQGALKRWYEDCFECRGTGQVHSVEDESSPEYDSGKFKDCPDCGGKGKVRR